MRTLLPYNSIFTEMVPVVQKMEIHMGIRHVFWFVYENQLKLSKYVGYMLFWKCTEIE